MNGGRLGRSISDQWLRSKELAAGDGQHVLEGRHRDGVLGRVARIGHCQYLITGKWYQ